MLNLTWLFQSVLCFYANWQLIELHACRYRLYFVCKHCLLVCLQVGKYGVWYEVSPIKMTCSIFNLTCMYLDPACHIDLICLNFCYAQEYIVSHMTTYIVLLANDLRRNIFFRPGLLKIHLTLKAEKLFFNFELSSW